MTALYEKLADEPSMKPFADFYIWCIKKFKNPTRSWRTLDTSLNMKLTYLEFLTSLREHDFKGDGRVIFKILDRDRSGSLSYFHFDPSGATALAKLIIWAEEKFGSVEAAFDTLDTDKNGKLTPDEFRKAARHHGLETEEPVHYLFQMIDLDANKMITKKEVSFLDAWGCPPWLKVQPDYEGCEAFKQHLIRKYRDNAIVAWHHLDQNDMMRVSWEEFLAACKRLKLDDSKLPAIWRALDDNLSGWISLHEFASDTYHLLVKFKKWATSKFGSIHKLCAMLDTNHDGFIARKEFMVVKSEMNLNDDEYRVLFHGLDLEGKGMIKFAKLRYIDAWNIEEDIKEEEFWQGIQSCLAIKTSDNAQ